VCACACVANLAPVAVVLHAVDGQGDHLHASLLELVADPGGAGELGGADGSEVLRVGEQNAPSAEGNTHTHTHTETTKRPNGSTPTCTLLCTRSAFETIEAEEVAT